MNFLESWGIPSSEPEEQRARAAQSNTKCSPEFPKEIFFN